MGINGKIRMVGRDVLGVVKSHAPNEIKPCSQQTTLKGLVGSDSSVQIPTSDRILGLTFKICCC